MEFVNLCLLKKKSRNDFRVIRLGKRVSFSFDRIVSEIWLFLDDLGGDWFSRYHPQTQLLRLVAVVGGLQQSLKSL